MIKLTGVPAQPIQLLLNTTSLSSVEVRNSDMNDRQVFVTYEKGTGLNAQYVSVGGDQPSTIFIDVAAFQPQDSLIIQTVAVQPRELAIGIPYSGATHYNQFQYYYLDQYLEYPQYLCVDITMASQCASALISKSTLTYPDHSDLVPVLSTTNGSVTTFKFASESPTYHIGVYGIVEGECNYEISVRFGNFE